MRNFSQYLMLSQAILLFPVLAIAATLLYRRVRLYASLGMMMGSWAMVLGALYSSVFVFRDGGRGSGLPFEDVLSLQQHLALAGIITYGGFVIFAFSFLLFVINVKPTQKS